MVDPTSDVLYCNKICQHLFVFLSLGKITVGKGEIETK